MIPVAGSELPARAWPALEAALTRLPGLVVAYSGGVDSSALVGAALQVLGRERVIAVLGDSASLARAEHRQALRTAALLGVEVHQVSTDEMQDPRYRANAGDRCFWCKEALFLAAGAVAEQRGWPLAYGETADDVGDHRPGARSASARGVRAPLREAGWGKAEVRAYAHARGLPIADKPASPCLASRLPVGVTVSDEALARVERVEQGLRTRGYQVLRARHYGATRTVLEFAADELPRARAEEATLVALARGAGYRDVTLRAYRSGAVSV